MHSFVEGSKRQLPSWMMPKVIASHENNSSNVVETNISTEIGAANVRKIDHEKKSNSSAKCEVKGKIDLGKENESGDNITEKKKKKGNKSSDRAPRRSVRKRQNLEDLSHHSSNRVCQDQAYSDDEMELTVEDLMAIAEQYVKAYEDKKPQETTNRQCEPIEQLPATTTLDSHCESEKSASLEREALYSSVPTTGEVIPTSTSQIDHHAQDMLDVFLGPLLRTAFEKEEKLRKANLS